MMEDLTNLEIQILRVLDAHQGKGSAISRNDLVAEINAPAPLFPVHERKIRETIKHLTTQHGVAIGSCHSGYFMAVTQQEIEEVCKYYDGYVRSMGFVSSRLRKIEMREYFGQMSLEFSPQHKEAI